MRPFSHQAGTCCLIPHTCWEARIYPTKIFFRNLIDNRREELNLPLKGPMKRFTVVLDLEKECIEIFGISLQGYFQYKLLIENDQLILRHKKKGEHFLPFISIYKQELNKERLFLGIHKKQDWDLVCRRKMMEEIFPFWIRLSQIIPKVTAPEKPWGNFALLEKGIEKKDVVDHFSLIFQTTFQGILSPRIKDENYLGVLPEETIPSTISPIGLIHEGARKIRRLFFQEDGDKIFILPGLPPEFHSGSFVAIQTSLGDHFDLEWSKKEIKKICIFPKKTRFLTLCLQKKIHSFRLKKTLKGKGERYKSTDNIEIQQDIPLYLDRFEH